MLMHLGILSPQTSMACPSHTDGLFQIPSHLSHPNQEYAKMVYPPCLKNYTIYHPDFNNQDILS